MNTVYILYSLVDCGESISDCHTLYSTLEKAKAAMEIEIQECMKNFHYGKVKKAKAAMEIEIQECMKNFHYGKVKHDLERLYEFVNEDGQGFTVGIDEQIPL